MPQMSPMSWTLVFILCLTSSMISMVAVHYIMCMNNDKSYSNTVQSSNKMNLKFNI